MYILAYTYNTGSTLPVILNVNLAVQCKMVRTWRTSERLTVKGVIVLMKVNARIL
jgi:hypothetical protein